MTRPRRKGTPKRALSRQPAAVAHPKAASRRLLGDLRQLIEDTRQQTAQVVNAGLVHLYWRIGERIRREVLQGGRGGYGERIVSALGRQLSAEYGSGFSEKSLRHMVRFVEVFPDFEIVSALRRQLGWTHFKSIIYLDNPLQRDFYTEMCRIERWSTRTLGSKIDSMLYERTGLSRKPAELAKQELQSLRAEDRMSPDLVFRDPYVLDFLGLKDTFSEKDLEAAILREIERFLLELGTDFTFVARQKRMPIGSTDYYLDLLFYHRRLKALVAIELKLGKFRPADTGQMELYLRWLDEHERRPDENPPLGVFLCGYKDHEEIALLRLDQKGIRVAEYLTELPPKSLLTRKLHEAIRTAKERLVGQGPANKVEDQNQ